MKKVCVVTATRAEYGQLKPVIERLLSIEEIELQLLVTGTHLLEEYGYSYREIEEDGIQVTRKVFIPMKSNDSLDICHVMGETLSKVADELNSLSPNLILILGDRYEMLAVASAAIVLNIPIAHISGGDITLGAIDDYFRNAITKMSYLHFAFTEKNRCRIIQMGEDPSRVYNVGALGIENIRNINLLSPEEIYKKLGVYPNENTVLVTYHPVTSKYMSNSEDIKCLFSVLSRHRELEIIFTKANSDCGGKIINKEIEEFSTKNSQRTKVFASLGTLNYLSIMKNVGAVIGNSSSGIVEAPSLKVPTINIGSRQQGRQQAKSIINCKMSEDDIENAIQTAFSEEYRSSLKEVKNPFEGVEPSMEIADKIQKFLLSTQDINKAFYDIGGEIEF